MVTTNQQGGHRVARKVDINDIAFGVEIECAIPREAFRNAGWNPPRGWNNTQAGSHDHVPVPGFYSDETGFWKLETDGSITGSGDYILCEVIVEKPVSGFDGIRKIQDMLAKLRSMGARVNSSCGLHVNVSHPDLFKVAYIRRLCRLFARYEFAMFAMTGSVSRTLVNYFQESYRRHPYAQKIKDDFKAMGIDEMRSLVRARRVGKYYALNIGHVAEPNPSARRVEFRVFASTINSTKMAAYIRVCLGLVQASMEMSGKPVWDLVKRDNEQEWPDGVHAVKKLFNGPLKWFPSCASPTQERSGAGYSSIARGLHQDDPNKDREIEKSARIIMKMAKKVDEGLARHRGQGPIVWPSVTRRYRGF
jgi:hypothetical protein